MQLYVFEGGFRTQTHSTVHVTRCGGILSKTDVTSEAASNAVLIALHWFTLVVDLPSALQCAPCGMASWTTALCSRQRGIGTASTLPNGHTDDLLHCALRTPFF